MHRPDPARARAAKRPSHVSAAATIRSPRALAILVALALTTSSLVALGTTTAHADDAPPTATPPTAPTTTPTTQPSDSTMVTIPDLELSICIYTALGQTEYRQTFSTAELASITSLSCDLVSNLTGISAMTGLTSLDLWDGSISDVTPLSGLTGLQTLDISGNAISDLSPLAALATDGHTTITAGEQRLDAGNPIDGVPFTLPVVKNPDGTEPTLTTGQGITISSDGLTATPTSEQTSGKITWGDTTSRTGFSGTISFVVFPGVCDISTATYIGGTAVVGQQVYVGLDDPLALSGSDVSIADQWFRDGVLISTASAYSLTPADYGTRITAETTLSKPGCPDVAQASGGVTVGVSVPPVNYQWIVPNGWVGLPITTQAPGWMPNDIVLSYQWFSNGAPITGATSSTYTPVPADVSHSISVEWYKTIDGVTTDLGGTNRALIGDGGLGWSTPQITGTLQAGSRVGVNVGTWISGVAFAYQWYHNGSTVPGATASSFVVPTSFAGSSISVKVTVTAPGYFPSYNYSPAAQIASVFPKSTLPKIAGSPTLGHTVTADVGAWSPSGIAFTYQWKRAGQSIPGATRPTYAITPSDVTHPLTVTVTATKAGYTTLARTSPAVTPPAGRITQAPIPTITGTSAMGHVLAANLGTWSPGVAVHVQWRHNGSDIAGATGRSYTVHSTDVGTTITVVVTGTRAGYASVGRASAGKDVAVVAYATCKALNAVYPHGVARSGVSFDLRSGHHSAVYAGTYVNTPLYNANSRRDADKDGIACEKP